MTKQDLSMRDLISTKNNTRQSLWTASMKSWGEITFQNKPADFSKLLVKAKRYCTDGKKLFLHWRIPMPEDKYWTLSQLVNRRANLKTHHIRLKNQLHEQICMAYPGYKKFFQDIGRPTALYFWEHYPSSRILQGKSVEELAEELIPISHNQFSIRKCQKILDA